MPGIFFSGIFFFSLVWSLLAVYSKICRKSFVDRNFLTIFAPQFA